MTAVAAVSIAAATAAAINGTKFLANRLLLAPATPSHHHGGGGGHVWVLGEALLAAMWLVRLFSRLAAVAAVVAGAAAGTLIRRRILLPDVLPAINSFFKHCPC
jgi:hypothetical protein